jgi:hypothetical protein
MMRLSEEQQVLWENFGGAYFHQDFDLECVNGIENYLMDCAVSYSAKDRTKLHQVFQNALAKMTNAELSGLWRRAGSDMIFVNVADARTFFESAELAFRSTSTNPSGR